MAGRPSSLSKAKIKGLADSVAQGLSFEGACGQNGVWERAFYRWLEIGIEAMELKKRTKHQESCVQLCQAIKKASSDFEADCVRELRDQPPGWQRFAWLLERRLPKRWAADRKDSTVDNSVQYSFVEPKK